MQVIAQRGSTNFMLLVEGRRDRLKQAKVRVFDQRASVIGPEMPALSVIARGYWGDVADDVDLEAVVAEAEGLLSSAA